MRSRIAVARVVANAGRRLVFGRLVRGIADRFGAQAATRWTREVLRYRNAIDEVALRSAIASGNLRSIQSVINAGALQTNVERTLREPFLGARQAAGTKSAAMLRHAGIAADFRTTHPNVVLGARQHAAEAVVGIADQTRQVIAEVIAGGAAYGLTVQQQARAIRHVVGLPPNWAQAPLRLGDELRAGNVAAATRRRLSAADRAMIRSRIAAGTVDDAFVNTMMARYSERLVNRRAINIARTETLRAAHAGLQESWEQATQQGALPSTTRRFWLPTPDTRLSPEHARIPSMNPQGRGLKEPFTTTEGLHMYPPSRPNCRCSVALAVVPPGTTVTPDLTDADVLAQPSVAYTKVNPDAEMTLDRYFRNGQLTPERQQLHDAIVRKHFEGVTPVGANETPTAHMLGGGPASGKSSVMAKTPPNYVHIDPDAIRAMLPEFSEGVANGVTNIAAQTHSEAKMISERIASMARSGRYNALVDGTGDNTYEHLAKAVAQYRDSGHRVVASYVSIDTEEAVARMIARGQRTGRFVPEEYMRGVHENVSRILPRAMREGLFDDVRLFDNNGSMAFEMAHARRLHTGEIRFDISREDMWQRFLSKGQPSAVYRNWPAAIDNGGTGLELTVGRAGRLERHGALRGEELRHYLGAYGEDFATPVAEFVGTIPDELVGVTNPFRAASELVRARPELNYVEGIAYNAEGRATYHAWAVAPDGSVIDIAWGNTGSDYFGVQYERRLFLEMQERRRAYGVLTENASDVADWDAVDVVRRGGSGIRVEGGRFWEGPRAPRPQVADDFETALRAGDAASHLQKMQSVAPPLEEEQLYALLEYQNGSYSRLNKGLRRAAGGAHPNAELDDLKRVLDTVYDTHKGAVVGQRTVLFRGGRLDATVGDEFIDHGFASCSTDYKKALSFKMSGGPERKFIRILAEPGTEGVWMDVPLGGKSHYRESEFLLRRGTRFRVVADRFVSHSDWNRMTGARETAGSFHVVDVVVLVQ